MGGSVWVIVAVLVMVCGGGYGWQEGRSKGGVFVSFASRDVVRGYGIKGNALIVKYGLVLGSVLVNERKLDFCWDIGVDVNLESTRSDEISWGCDFIYHAPVEGMVVDMGGMIFRNFRSSSSLPRKFWATRVWSYGLYAGVMMENVILRPSLYCIYRSYTEEVALEGR
ncbi:MAG: hypothetical protein LBF49_03615, partial [Puniceicoccales bacterium]|nr:hypothetical protein [Puniceicoccales bacterium]